MTSAAVSSAGILAGNGSAIVHALVYHHPVPQSAPDAFADLLDSERAPDGSVQDWQLSLRKLLAHRDDHVHDVWSSFATWRRTYVAERVVADVATVRSFLSWADKVTDVTACHALNLPKVSIEARLAPKLAWQVHEAQRVCRERGDVGLGISVPQRTGLVRGFVVGDEPVLLLSDHGASVSAVRDGLELVDAETSRPSMLVHGWVVDGHGVTAISDEGPVQLENSRAGRLLAHVAPGVAQASASAAPLASVFSGLFHGLRESATLAAADHVPLHIRTGPAVH